MVSPQQPIVVLVVEDDFLLRSDAMQMLEEAGFGVVEAADSDQAILILEARPDINVMFTDIDMPGSIDGMKLAHAVRGRWPPIKIIATSGHYKINSGDLPTGGKFIPKPYNFKYVADVIREVVLS